MVLFLSLAVYLLYLLMGITRLAISRWTCATNQRYSLSLCHPQRNFLFRSHFSSSTAHSFVKTADVLSFISGPPEAIDHSQKISLKEERDIIDSIIRIVRTIQPPDFSLAELPSLMRFHAWPFLPLAEPRGKRGCQKNAGKTDPVGDNNGSNASERQHYQSTY